MFYNTGFPFANSLTTAVASRYGFRAKVTCNKPVQISYAEAWLCTTTTLVDEHGKVQNFGFHMNFARLCTTTDFVDFDYVLQIQQLFWNFKIQSLPIRMSDAC